MADAGKSGHGRAPERVMIHIALALDEDGFWGATALSVNVGELGQRGDSEDEENPYEAAWNALANCMTALGYDDEERA